MKTNRFICSGIEQIPSGGNSQKEKQVSCMDCHFTIAVQKFIQGDSSLFNNEEFIGQLPGYLVQLFQNKKEDEAHFLLDRLGECILSSKDMDREHGLKAIDVIDGFISASKQAAENDTGIDFEEAIHAFEQGDYSFLHNKEFVKKLPHHILQLYLEGIEERTLLLIERLGTCILNDTVAEREKALMVIAVLNNLAISAKKIPLIQKLLHLLVKWLAFETTYLVGFSVICLQLQRIGQVLVRNNLKSDVDKLLEVISKIENGGIEKNEIILNMVSKIREHIVLEIRRDESVQLLQHTSRFHECEEPYSDRSAHGTIEFFALLQDFASGSDCPLDKKVFVEKLPHYIYQIYTKGLQSEALSLLDRIEECLQGSNVTNRENCLMAITVLNTLSLESGNLGLIQRLFQLLIELIRHRF